MKKLLVKFACWILDYYKIARIEKHGSGIILNYGRYKTIELKAFVKRDLSEMILRNPSPFFKMEFNEIKNTLLQQICNQLKEYMVINEYENIDGITKEYRTNVLILLGGNNGQRYL